MAAKANVSLPGGLSLSDFQLEAGNLGLKIFGGYIVEDYDPSLRGIYGKRQLREMQDSDPTCGAILFVIWQSIRKIAWHVAPADKSPLAQMAAEAVESMMGDMENPWSDFIAEVLSMFTYGFAPFEIVLKERKGFNTDPKLSSKFNDNMIGVRKLALRGQDTILRWIMDADNNDVIGMVQLPWTGGIRTIPVEKLINFKTMSIKGNPEGRSLLRNAYRPYYFRKRMEEIEAIGVERDLAGLPVMKVPAELIQSANSGADPQAAQTLEAYKNLVRNIRRNTQEGVVIPSNVDDKGKPLFELALLSGAGQRQFDTSKIIERYTQNIATTVMADFLLLGHSGRSGGAQMGASKIDMFFDAIQGMVQAIADTLNERLIPLIARINGIPQQAWPKFYADKAEQIDIGKLGAYINALAASGMPLFPDPNLEGYLRNVAGLPDVDDQAQENMDQLAAIAHSGQIAQGVQNLHQAAAGTMAAAHTASHIAMNPPQRTPPTAPAPGGKGPPVPQGPTAPPMGMGGGGGAGPQGTFGPPRGVKKGYTFRRTTLFKMAA